MMKCNKCKNCINKPPEDLIFDKKEIYYKISFNDRKIYNKNKLLKKKRKKTKNVNKYKEEKENEIINEELFDKNGKITFTHVKLSDIDQNM